jgi:hypothetical protein
MIFKVTSKFTFLFTVFTLLLHGCINQPVVQFEPEQPAPEELFKAISNLKSFINDENKLDGKQIEANAKTITKNKEWLGKNREAIKATVDLIETYEKTEGPLFVATGEISRKKRKTGDEIHWAMLSVMQNLFDELYNNKNIERYNDIIDGLKFKCSEYFPGKVDHPEDPDEVYTVKINGSYPDSWGAPILGEDLPARKPTGAYLAPGSVATVTVPDSMVGKGYKVRVGAHSWDLKRKPRVKRLYRISKLYDINSNEVKVANPLGGGIYIEVPFKSDAGIIDISIRNAVRAPYFSWKSFHKTSNEEWKKVERNYKAPWADFQSDKFMMQVPTTWIYKMDDPEKLMKDWDAAMDAMNDLMGRPRLHGRETLYAQVDTQLRGRAFHPGYPSVNCGFDPTKDCGGNWKHHLVAGPRKAHSYEFHEKGHGFLFTKYVGDREAAVNFPHVAVFNRAFGVDLQESFRSSRGVTNKFKTLETTAVEWMMIDSFVNKTGMKNYERQYQLKGHAKFVDIVRLFGWKPLDNFWKSINQDFEDGKPWPRDVKETDKYTMRISEQAGYDLRPLIHFWGILTQDKKGTDAAVKKAGLKPSAKIYDLLVKYKGLVPKNNKEFREFALKWWEKQPSPKGFTTERNHAARWDSYDEKEAEKVRKVVQEIIDDYFPNGRPKE